MDPLHEADQKEFDQYPAPLWERVMRFHPMHINHTLPFYGPMLYWIIRAATCENVVEIGVAEGYSSFFMASAIADNNTRYGTQGRYYGIDICIRPTYIDPILDRGLPATFIEANSLDITRDMLCDKPIDLIFQDGCHDLDHCLKELELYYPWVKDKGDGYIIMHDVHYLCEQYFDIIRKDSRYNFEFVRFINNYGLAICRKMDGYDESHRICPESWI